MTQIDELCHWSSAEELLAKLVDTLQYHVRSKTLRRTSTRRGSGPVCKQKGGCGPELRVENYGC